MSLAQAMNSAQMILLSCVCASFVCVNPLALYRTTRSFGNGRPSLGSSARTGSGPLPPISRMRRHTRPTPDPPPEGVTVKPAPISRYASRPPPEGVTVRYASRAPAPPPPDLPPEGVTVRYASRAPAPPPPRMTVRPGVTRRNKIRVEPAVHRRAPQGLTVKPRANSALLHSAGRRCRCRRR